jgi:hypothetical protein
VYRLLEKTYSYYTDDIGENNDLASQNPEILKVLISDYDMFAKDVGVIVPTAIVEAFQTNRPGSGRSMPG